MKYPEDYSNRYDIPEGVTPLIYSAEFGDTDIVEKGSLTNADGTAFRLDISAQNAVSGERDSVYISYKELLHLFSNRSNEDLADFDILTTQDGHILTIILKDDRHPALIMLYQPHAGADAATFSPRATATEFFDRISGEVAKEGSQASWEIYERMTRMIDQKEIGITYQDKLVSERQERFVLSLLRTMLVLKAHDLNDSNHREIQAMAPFLFRTSTLDKILARASRLRNPNEPLYELAQCRIFNLLFHDRNNPITLARTAPLRTARSSSLAPVESLRTDPPISVKAVEGGRRRSSLPESMVDDWFEDSRYIANITKVLELSNYVNRGNEALFELLDSIPPGELESGRIIEGFDHVFELILKVSSEVSRHRSREFKHPRPQEPLVRYGNLPKTRKIIGVPYPQAFPHLASGPRSEVAYTNILSSLARDATALVRGYNSRGRDELRNASRIRPGDKNMFTPSMIQTLAGYPEITRPYQFMEISVKSALLWVLYNQVNTINDQSRKGLITAEAQEFLIGLAHASYKNNVNEVIAESQKHTLIRTRR
jgi:hypothetical protein